MAARALLNARAPAEMETLCPCVSGGKKWVRDKCTCGWGERAHVRMGYGRVCQWGACACVWGEVRVHTSVGCTCVCARVLVG